MIAINIECKRTENKNKTKKKKFHLKIRINSKQVAIDLRIKFHELINLFNFGIGNKKKEEIFTSLRLVIPTWY